MSDTSRGRWLDGLHRGRSAVLDGLHRGRSAFRGWRHRRPFWGGLLVLLAGLEIFYSTQLSIGNLQIRIGIEGLQSIVIPVILIMAGVLIWVMPAHRVFYGVIALVVAVYSLIGVNFGGFFVGMLLGIVGGSLSVAWSPRTSDVRPAESGEFAEGADTATQPAEEIVPLDEIFDERQGRA